MAQAEFLKLLKSVRLLDQIADKPLAALADLLKPVDHGDGDVIFEQGATGDSLYFVLSGQIRISKKTASGAKKDIATLGPGNSVGEMALFEAVPRSATATAEGPTKLLRLGREDMKTWLKSNPGEAVEFYAEMAQVQSQRLRATSSELALLFDLSSVLLEDAPSAPELVRRAVERLLAHLPGQWTVSAYLYNPFNHETELACGPEVGAPKEDTKTFLVPLPASPKPLGFWVVQSAAPLSEQDRAELNLTLTTSARLVSAAVENVNHKLEEGLRARLRSSSHGPSI